MIRETSTSPDGGERLQSPGERIQHIAIPSGWTANVTFGGKDRNLLFITASRSVYTIEMKTHGAGPF